MLSEESISQSHKWGVLCFSLNCDVASKQSFIVSEEHKWRTIIIMVVATFSSLPDSSSLIIFSLTQHLREDIKRIFDGVVWVIASESWISPYTQNWFIGKLLPHLLPSNADNFFLLSPRSLQRDLSRIDKQAGKEKVSLFYHLIFVFFTKKNKKGAMQVEKFSFEWVCHFHSTNDTRSKVLPVDERKGFNWNLLFCY